jgi:hypothetical protein
MANICSFVLRVKGTKEARESFSNFFGDGKSGVKLDAHIDIEKQDESDATITSLYGWCKWSVGSRLFTPYKETLQELTTEMLTKIVAGESFEDIYISLTSACKVLELEVQIASEEQGVGFTEFYWVNTKGEIVEKIVTKISNNEVLGDWVREGWDDDLEEEDILEKEYSKVYTLFTI